MSGLYAQPKEKPKQVIADLDDLFTEHGIPLIGGNQHVILQIADHHSSATPLPTPLSTASGNALKGKPQLRFEGGEHTAIGDSTLLRFVKDAPAIPAAQVELHLPNGLALTYGQVVALGVISMEFPINRSAKARRSPTESSAFPTPLTRWRCCLLLTLRPS